MKALIHIGFFSNPRRTMNEYASALEERLVDFAVRILNVVDSLPKSETGKHIANQILRSGTAPAAHYGEAQSAESKKDFSHKLKLAAKELRETNVWLKIIQRKPLCAETRLIPLLKESDELIAIFSKSIKTTDSHPA